MGELDAKNPDDINPHVHLFLRPSFIPRVVAAALYIPALGFSEVTQYAYYEFPCS